MGNTHCQIREGLEITVFLLIVVIYIVTQTGEILTQSQVLNTFDDIEICETEAVRIRKDMKASYPNDTDYIITCKVNERYKRGT